jgi:hypothetical protein
VEGTENRREEMRIEEKRVIADCGGREGEGGRGGGNLVDRRTDTDRIVRRGRSS